MKNTSKVKQLCIKNLNNDIKNAGGKFNYGTSCGKNCKEIFFFVKPHYLKLCWFFFMETRFWKNLPSINLRFFENIEILEII
jgi:hypothetical protein